MCEGQHKTGRGLQKGRPVLIGRRSRTQLGQLQAQQVSFHPSREPLAPSFGANALTPQPGPGAPPSTRPPLAWEGPL